MLSFSSRRELPVASSRGFCFRLKKKGVRRSAKSRDEEAVRAASGTLEVELDVLRGRVGLIRDRVGFDFRCTLERWNGSLDWSTASEASSPKFSGTGDSSSHTLSTQYDPRCSSSIKLSSVETASAALEGRGGSTGRGRVRGGTAGGGSSSRARARLTKSDISSYSRHRGGGSTGT